MTEPAKPTFTFRAPDVPLPEPLLVLHPIWRQKKSTVYSVQKFVRWAAGKTHAVVPSVCGVESSVPAQSAVFVCSNSPLRVEYKNSRAKDGEKLEIEIVEPEKDNAPLITAAESP